jgi:hypothetical protein
MLPDAYIWPKPDTSSRHQLSSLVPHTFYCNQLLIILCSVYDNYYGVPPNSRVPLQLAAPEPNLESMRVRWELVELNTAVRSIYNAHEVKWKRCTNKKLNKICVLKSYDKWNSAQCQRINDCNDSTLAWSQRAEMWATIVAREHIILCRKFEQERLVNKPYQSNIAAVFSEPKRHFHANTVTSLCGHLNRLEVKRKSMWEKMHH